MLFAWIDEWFKKNWLVIDYEVPLDRKPLWYNAHDAEENYGLIAYRPGSLQPRIRIDGRADDWAGVPNYLAGPDLRLKVLADEGWLHLALYFKGPVPDWAKEGFAVGIDTHGTAQGDHRLPWGLGLRSQAGLEFMVRFQGAQSAVYADAPYDLFTHHLDRPIRSVDNDAGQFVMPRTESNRARIGRDGTRYPSHQQEIGWLRRGTQDRADAEFDSRAEWREGDAGNGWSFLEARIPWGLLNVTDPSSRRVVQDEAIPGDAVGTTVTEGFRLSLVRFHTTGPDALRVTASLPEAQAGLLPLTPVYTWPTWETPTFHRVRKESFQLVKHGLLGIPDAGRALPSAPAPAVSPAAPAPEALAALLERARRDRDAGRLSAAIQAYDAMLAQVPDHETALLERAETLGWAGRYPEAHAGYLAFHRAHPARAFTADLALARLAAWQDRTSEAMNLLEPWMKQGQQQAVLDGARYLSWRARFPESLGHLRQWLSSHPGDREAILLEAQVLSWAGRNAEARAAYGRVLATQPGDREALLGLTRLALWEGDDPEARRTIDRMPPATLTQPESQLMLAQVEAAEGHTRSAWTKIRAQAAGGPVRREAGELETDLARAYGPWVELSADQTRTSEGLQMAHPGLRVRFPWRDGALSLAQTFHSSDVNGLDSRPSESRISLHYPLRPGLSATGSLSHFNGSGLDPTWGYALGVDYTPLPGLGLSLANEKGLALFTPQSVSRHTAFVTTDLGASWRFGQGHHTLRAGLGHAGFRATVLGEEQSSSRKSWLASYEYRFPVTAFDLRAGAMVRDFGYSRTLNLGFFNPESYRWTGAFTSATWRSGRTLELSMGVTAGSQTVNHAAGEFTWSYRLGTTWSPRSWPVDLSLWWNQSFAGLPVTTPIDPSTYQEHTLGISLRVRASGWM
jgi:tetratricopeptide (TPR) repeat protein